MVVALIAGAGKGNRMKHHPQYIQNKLFINIKGKPIIFYTLNRFEECNLIDEIYLVLDKESIESQEKDIKNFGIKKLKKIIVGGKTRGESVYKGLKEIPRETKFVSIHDGARPFVSKEKIEEVIKGAYDTGASILAIPLFDTLKEIDGNNYIKGTLPREKYVRVQTPQVFKTEIIKEAYEKLGVKEGFKNTDEASLVEKMGHKIKVIWGEASNIKITTPFDLRLAEIIIKEEETWT